MSLITRSIGPNAQGEKLTFAQMDNNLYYLQSLGISGLTYSANTLSVTNPTGGTISTNIGGVNRWFISSGETITIDSFYQSFVYGDVVVEGTLDIKENSQLVIINGDLINSGGTIVQSGDTYLIDLPLVDTSVDSFVYSNNTFTITDNFGETYSAILNVVTGLTVNGVLSATTINATTIDLCGSNGTLYTGTISGCSPIDILSETYFYEGLSATTISGDTFYGDGSNLTGINLPSCRININGTSGLSNTNNGVNFLVLFNNIVYNTSQSDFIVSNSKIQIVNSGRYMIIGRYSSYDMIVDTNFLRVGVLTSTTSSNGDLGTTIEYLDTGFIGTTLGGEASKGGTMIFNASGGEWIGLNALHSGAIGGGGGNQGYPVYDNSFFNQPYLEIIKIGN